MPNLGLYQTRAQMGKGSAPEPNPTATVVGESPNSKGVDKYDTLSGKRLYAIMGLELPWWNIHGAEPPKWNARVAKARVQNWIEFNPGASQPLILLGRKVCLAFGIGVNEPWLEWYRTAAHAHPMITVPHPSPRNRWWSVPENFQAAAALLQAVAKKEIPHVEFKNVVEDE